MSKSMKAGVVCVTRFVDKTHTKNGKLIETFKNYIDYIDRDKAIRSEHFTKYNLSSQYKDYNDYMGNPEKSSGIFTSGNDSLSPEQLSVLKDAFQKSFDNDNIMWQTVVSFDNRFLAQLGIYDPSTGLVDEHILQESTRRMMNEALKRENMTHTAVWSAAIHYNTDNIHIHIAYTEPVNTRQMKNVDGKERPRGKFKGSTLGSMKSAVVNTLLNNEYTKVDYLVREKFVGSKKMDFTPDDKRFRDMWYRIYDNLPKDKNQWFYNMNGMKPLRPLLDELTRQYLTSCHPNEYMEFQKAILHQQSIYQAAYGKNSRYRDYSKNKMEDLYTRMGNAILSEMRQYSRSAYAYHDLYAGRGHGGKLVPGRLRSALEKVFGDVRRQNELEHKQLEADIKMGGSYGSLL